MMKAFVVTALSLAVACVEAGNLFTPETSRLFERRIEPLSGHAYCLLKPFAGEHSRQSLYFTAKSMTDDGRFLLFWAYDVPENGQGRGQKATYAVDFAADKIVKLPITPQIPFIDVKTDQVWYFRRDPSGDSRKDAVCRLDLKNSLADEIFVCNMPEALVMDVKKVHYYATHPTLTRDRKKMFIATHLDDRYEQGCINLETGTWESWGRTPFFANHDQLCPADDNLALVAWEACARTEDALAYRKKTGWYPRMWLCRPDGSRELQPSKLPNRNYATHEHWTEDGSGFYWCHEGVLLQDLATGKQSEIVPWKAAHAAMTADNRYVTFDHSVGKWYRGCQWQVGFWNREAGRGTYIFPYRPALCSDKPGSKRHPDPHPQFVCNDRYVVCTINSADGHMDLAVVPVDQLVARTAVDPMSYFAGLPSEAEPAHVSKRLAEHFLECPADDYKPQGYRYRNYGGKLVEYPLISLWVNLLANASMAADKDLEARLIAHFEPFFGEKKAKQSAMNHVDYSVFGALPLEIWLHNKDPRALELGLKYADTQWTPPSEATLKAKHALPLEEQRKFWEDGYTPQTRLWIDDMYMITLLQMQAWRATGKDMYLKRTAREMALYIDRLQVKDGSAAGLFYHAPDVPYVWGRGAGWMAAGMALVLRHTPPQNVDYHKVLGGYRRMMSALLKYQREDGLWGQLVNEPSSWAETSGSAMFTFAFVEGVRNGWLEPETYGPAARKAYLALVGKLDEYANLKDVCIGTGKRNDHQYYLDRPREAGDPHGQAALSWICGALMRSASTESDTPKTVHSR